MKALIKFGVTFYRRMSKNKSIGDCLFEPSCSEYMLLAVEKYGSIKGLIMGLKRIYRCRLPNGGTDYP